MAVQTPITNSTVYSVAGDLRIAIAKFTSVANNDTYTAPLSTIYAVSVDGGSTGGTLGATWSNSPTGATVTFLSSSGSITNVSLVMFGS